MQLQNNAVIVAAAYVAIIGVAGLAGGITSAAAWVSLGALALPPACSMLTVWSQPSRPSPLSRWCGDDPPIAAVVDGAVEARWLAWKARGAASDRRTGRIMGRLFAIAVILFAGWLVAELR